jgi:hypothetical protein
LFARGLLSVRSSIVPIQKSSRSPFRPGDPVCTSAGPTCTFQREWNKRTEERSGGLFNGPRTRSSGIARPLRRRRAPTP